VRRALLGVSLIGLLVAGIVLLVDPDPLYRLQTWVARGRYKKYDPTISAVAERSRIDPFLLKAIAWQLSDLDARKVGADGGYGLFQIKEPAARAWAAAERIETFMLSDLFDPETNTRIAAWYLERSFQNLGGDCGAPEDIVLAEFHQGKPLVLSSPPAAADIAIFLEPARLFIQSVQNRRTYYAEHGW
jgi:hypothetical protein